MTREGVEKLNNMKRTLTSVILILIGFLLAVGYPYLLFFTSEETSIKVMKLTFSILFIVLGSLASATGAVLLKGVKRTEE